MKSKSTIRRHERELRKIVDENRNDGDVVLFRMAYAMAETLRWVTMTAADSRSFESVARDARLQSSILHGELQRSRKP